MSTYRFNWRDVPTAGTIMAHVIPRVTKHKNLYGPPAAAIAVGFPRFVIEGMTITRRVGPMIAGDQGIKFNLNSIERDTFYEVEYNNQKYAVRVTDDGFLERYEVE